MDSSKTNEPELKNGNTILTIVVNSVEVITQATGKTQLPYENYSLTLW